MMDLCGTKLAKALWGYAQDALVPLAGRPAAKDSPRVYYGGARAGFAGGPQVKTGWLQQSFPQTIFGFNLVYLLSGAFYLSPESLRRLNRKNIPIVLNQNGVFFSAWYPQGWEKQNERMARALQSATHVFYQSAFCKRAADHFLGVQPRAHEVLYNALDTQLFTPSLAKPMAGRPARLLLTGKIGASTQSRLLSTIEGLSAARQAGLEAVLDVYGLIDDGVMRAAQSLLERDSLTEAVFFKGSYTREAAPQIYQSADIYVMNKHNDSCPNTVLEALSCGLPVLYSASGGVPELVGHEAGFGMVIEESFDHEITPSAAQFVQGLEAITRSRDKMAVAARARACAMFDIHHWIARHRAVFDQLIKDRS